MPLAFYLFSDGDFESLPMPTYHFHIRRALREKYQADETLFSLRGTVVFANFYAARVLTRQNNID